MSIIRDRILTLETIVSTSNVIVEVEALEPYEESVSIPSADGKNPVPDFIKKGFIFRVKRVLKNTSNNSIPERIRVPNENWMRYFSQHKEHYANGPSKSFTVNTYQTKVSSMENSEILFLCRFQDSFHLTAKNSFESLEANQTIEQYISS